MKRAFKNQFRKLVTVVTFFTISVCSYADFGVQAGYGSNPCDVTYKVFDSFGNLLLSGNPKINSPSPTTCFTTGVPSYVEFSYPGLPLFTVTINTSKNINLPCRNNDPFVVSVDYTSGGPYCQNTLYLHL